MAGWFSGYAKETWNLPVGYTRKIFHFIIFTLAGIIGLTVGFPGVQVFGASIGFVVGYAVLKGHESRFYRAIARPSDAPYERFYIIVPFCMTALGGMISNICFGHYAIVGYITTGWGDAVAEPVGTRWGRHKYQVSTLTGIKATRSLEGSLAVLLASFFGCVLLFGMGFDVTFVTMISVSLLIAVIAMIVEAATFHSMDNLTIQVATSGVCFWILG
ncbi:MAG: hypothetical protein C4527_24530 [Candidatus Omnitrophota bacterium]|nr:MAG: hypothetical protein C4527_24530 [Candidatus Omnitrophota bacterium]